jgi:hypothetical protein
MMTANRSWSAATRIDLLLALIKARRPPQRERSVRFQLPALRSTADAADGIAAIAAAAALGAITPGEAAEFRGSSMLTPEQSTPTESFNGSKLSRLS